MVLNAHQDKSFRGAQVASLSVPWGESSEERPGYHLVWPRDLVECAGALLALGAEVEAREDGSWFQNQWLGGKAFWTGIQLDQVAFPVLLAGTLADRGALDGIEVEDMVRRALGFIARSGPVSPQDRWEENSGVNAFTGMYCSLGFRGTVSVIGVGRLCPGTGRLLECATRSLDSGVRYCPGAEIWCAWLLSTKHAHCGTNR